MDRLFPRKAWDLPAPWSLAPDQQVVDALPEFWDGLAASWTEKPGDGKLGDHWSDGTPEMVLEHLTAIAKPTGTKQALEIGCGAGRMTRVAAPLFAAVEATDFSAGMLQVARDTGPPANVTWHEADATDLGAFPPGKFDCAYGLDVMPLLSDFHAHWALQALHRVLKPGGQVVLSWRTYRGDLPRFAMLSRMYRERHNIPKARAFLVTKEQVAWLAMLSGFELTLATDGPSLVTTLTKRGPVQAGSGRNT